MGYKLINIGQTASENHAKTQMVRSYKNELEIVTH